MKVLVVEDDVLILLSLAELIRRMGYEPVISSSGEDALRLASLHAPQLVLMDVRLDDSPIDGIEVAKEIRRHQTCGLLFLTGLGDLATRERAAAASPDAYITKPFNPKELWGRMEELLHAG
jgi:DNA-binding response OmpR family regulator